MSYIKWIYGMITDGTYPQFKDKYQKAVNNNKEEFMWGKESMRTLFAQYVCRLVDKHLIQEYEDHLEQEIIRQEAYNDDYISY
jgi:lipopolysaccharide biosynthesis regulator YciM